LVNQRNQEYHSQHPDMPAPLLPLIVEPEELERHLGMDSILIVDLCKPEIYVQSHIPGAVHLDYAQIVAVHRPVMGLLPDDSQLEEAFSSIGLTPEHHVVAYDDEGGGRASRLLWTLEAMGHSRLSLLNGGLHAWGMERRPLKNGTETRTRSQYRVKRRANLIADKTYILKHLADPAVVLLDARSADEYRGSKRFAERGGHIPGAVNLDWMQTMDMNRGLRFKPAEELRAMLTSRGVTPDKEVVCYCQSHHRSAHSCMMLKSLGFTRVRGYPGSWSDWGNSPDTPVE
jgi:thiosulfate/3-mercaptopyruvate sulfurtransferase